MDKFLLTVTFLRLLYVIPILRIIRHAYGHKSISINRYLKNDTTRWNEISTGLFNCILSLFILVTVKRFPKTNSCIFPSYSRQLHQKRVRKNWKAPLYSIEWSRCFQMPEKGLIPRSLALGFNIKSPFLENCITSKGSFLTSSNSSQIAYYQASCYGH